MDNFLFFLKEGFYHITDPRGYDHILFVAAICLPYSFAQWRKVLILVTAFTIGHSITLSLSVYQKILIPSNWIEFLIPVTIVITALQNIRVKKVNDGKSRGRYVLALLFGLIHGIGFSNYLRSMMGKNTSILQELLAFNIGLEIGQLIIVLVVLLWSWMIVQVFKAPEKDWKLFASGGIFGIAFIMALQRAAEL